MRRIRVRQRLRQVDVARRAGMSQATVSRIERGESRRLQLATVGSVAAALEAEILFDLRWRGGELPRLLGAGHSAMHEAVARLLNRRPGWLFAPEVSFSIYGERGVIDVLAFHPGRGALLVIELKTQLVDVQGLIGSVDRYRRLARRVAVPRGWRPRHVSSLVLLRDTQTNRRHVAAHGAVLRAAFPADGRFIRRWLKAPDAAVDGLGFLSVSLSRSASAASAGVQRVRRPPASVGRKRPAAGSRKTAPSIPPRNR